MAKNSEVYKTAQERAAAFKKWFAPYANPVGMSNYPIIDGIFHWLDLEAEDEKPLSCPFCGAECRTFELFLDKEHYVVCDKCRYASSKASTEHEAIAAHNRVAKAAKESEAKHEAR